MEQTIAIKCPIHQNKNISHISTRLETAYPNRFACLTCYQKIIAQSSTSIHDFVELETFLNDATAPLANTQQISKYHITYQEVAKQISLDIDSEFEEVARQIRSIFDTFAIILQKHVSQYNTIRQQILLIKSGISDDSKHKSILQFYSQNQSNYQELEKRIINHVSYFQKAPSYQLSKKLAYIKNLKDHSILTDIKQYESIFQELQQAFHTFNCRLLNKSIQNINQVVTNNEPCKFIPSNLLSGPFLKFVIDKIHRQEQISNSKLLYRGVNDKLNYTSFMNKIMDHGPLLLIIKTSQDIIGGFAAIKVKRADDEYVADQEQRSFLFSLNSLKIYPLREGSTYWNSETFYREYALKIYNQTSTLTFSFGEKDLVINKQFQVMSEHECYQLSNDPLTPQTDIMDMEVFEIA